MFKTTIGVVALVAVGLSACGGSDDTTTTNADASDIPVAGSITDDLSSTTTVEPTNNLQSVHEACTGPAAYKEFEANYQLVGSIYRGGLQQLADERGITEEQLMSDFFAEMWNEDDATLSISGAWSEDSEYGMDEGGILAGVVYDCVLTTLDIPAHVLDHIGTTRALDGTQTDSWNDTEARWTYHPDNGLSITFWEA